MTLSVRTATRSYPIFLERGVLSLAGEKFDLSRKCLVLTDENIPKKYIDTILSQCKEPYLFTLVSGEDSKSLASFEKIISFMLEKGFTRSDCLISLGGGVIGDLGGFVASAFLRGVDFYNIPTTVLSQVDSSIGGKVAINFKGLKNMVGAFYPPKGVLIDPDVLSSLPQRQIANGLAESVKMALTFDEDFFRVFEEEDPMEKIDLIIEKSLLAKKMVVEEDEKEAGLRKVLNFGHTLAHGFESESFKTGEPLYHGECVALGMIPMCSKEVKERLIPVLQKLSLPTKWEGDAIGVVEAVSHDKKMSGKEITLVRVDKVGSFRLEKIPFSAFAEEVKGAK
ncbi:MAG: 3-dehydroquinate synthase [Clostridia bacterium]|nr:3-dehydroquinate synthase [Clostridia bacterium]